MPGELRRVLGLRDLVLIVVGTTIGSGIFLVPGAVLRQSGSDLGVALLVWVVGSVLALLGALTFGELGAMLPDAGGSYVYVREAFGPLPAFLLGWTLFLAISTGSTATLAVAFANYLGELAPLGPVTRKLVGVAMIGAVAAVNIRGVRHAATVQNWSTAVKVGAILALAAASLALGGSDGFHRADTRVFATPGSLAALSAAGVALLGVLWAYEGWQNVTNSAGEARDPQRTFARGIVLGTAALVAIYLTANVGYVAALGASGVAASDRVAADAVRALFGPPAAKLVTLAILVSIFSAANGLALTGPRMYFAMARDWGVLSVPGGGAPPLRHARPRDRGERRVGGAARRHGDLRAVVHLRGVRELVVRRPRRGECVRAAAPAARRASAIPRARLSRDAGPLHPRGRGAGD